MKIILQAIKVEDSPEEIEVKEDLFFAGNMIFDTADPFSSEEEGLDLSKLLCKIEEGYIIDRRGKMWFNMIIKR